jgi:hypothetical protein
MRYYMSYADLIFAFATAFLHPTIQCNYRACNVPPDAGLQKRVNFSTLIVGLAGTGDRTRTTCVAGSGHNRSAIHYDTIQFLEECAQ